MGLPDTTGEPSLQNQLQVFDNMMRQLQESEKANQKLHSKHQSASAAASTVVQEIPPLSPLELSFETGSLFDDKRHDLCGCLQHTSTKIVNQHVEPATNDTKSYEESIEERTHECDVESSMLHDDSSPRCMDDTASSHFSWRTLLPWKERPTQSRILIATASVIIAGVSLGLLLSRPTGRRRRR